MAGSRQFLVLTDNRIVKLQVHVCLIMKICNQVVSLGECLATNVELGSVEVVWGIGFQLEKSHEVVTAVFTGVEFELMGDEVREVK